MTVDFETFGIEGRPAYPPIPCGVSIKWPGKPAVYYAWGHVSHNNCGVETPRRELVKAWANPDGVLFQNGKFDVDVAEVHMGLPRLPWTQYHDTMFLLFLDDPHQKELSLKPSAERLLGMAPEERDEVGEWLVKHQPVPGVKISLSPKSDHYFMKYLPYAPGDLVGRYANGDVDRTEGVFNLLWPRTKKRQMLEAYDRERRTMPILLEVERQGVPVDLVRLHRDVASYQVVHKMATDWVLKRLKADKLPWTLNIDSGAQLMKHLVEMKLVHEDQVAVTDKGAFKTDKDTLEACIKDPVLTAMLKYRTQLGTCLGTFMEPWLEVAEQSGGLIFTTWNQTKTDAGRGLVGTRTGRLSSTPNFQNIPKEFAPTFKHLALEAAKALKPGKERDDLLKLAKKLPTCPLKLPELPLCRGYVIPFKGHVLLDRDYSQQELRVLAHFEGQVLMEKYLENPRMDVHDTATTLINGLLGTNYDRKPIKNTGFGLIYGMGLGKLAAKSKVSVDEAKKVKEAYLAIFPGLKDMYKDMKRVAQNDEPIVTWGGREYFCEPPKKDPETGRMMTFDYKLINVLVQGSSADCTKEAVIRFYEQKPPEAKLLLTVHDEILVSTPAKLQDKTMAILKSCMEGVEFAVPMLSDGAVGHRWDQLIDVED